MSVKHTNDFLGEHVGKDLHFILTKVKKLQEIDRKVNSLLDPQLAKYCQVANIADKVLILLVANAAIATQIRFLTRDLLFKFKSDKRLQHIIDIKCIVRSSPQAGTHAAQPQMSPLTATAAGSVKDIAATIQDPKLRAIMERIASHRDK